MCCSSAHIERESEHIILLMNHRAASLHQLSIIAGVRTARVRDRFMKFTGLFSFRCLLQDLAAPMMLALIVPAATARAAKPMYRVSDNGRYLVDAKSEPVFWQGDTEWELLYALTAQDARELLHTRRMQGFTIVQAMCDGMFPKWIPPN